MATAVWLAGCGHSTAGGAGVEPEAPRPVEAAPPEDGIAELPYLPIPLERTSSRFQRLWRAAVDAGDTLLEPPDTDTELAAWLEETLRPWLDARTDAIVTVRVELRELRGGSRDEYLVGAALLGYLFEDTARQLLDTRVPGPSGRRAQAAAPVERTDLLMEHARRAFQRCLATGLGGLEIAAWRQYCDDALHRLGPPSEADEDAEDPERDDDGSDAPATSGSADPQEAAVTAP